MTICPSRGPELRAYRLLRTSGERHAPPRTADAAARSVERVPARARVLRVGVVDGEALLLDGVGEVDHRAGEVRGAHPVDDDTDAVERLDDVPVQGALVEEELVAQAGT